MFYPYLVELKLVYELMRAYPGSNVLSLLSGIETIRPKGYTVVRL